MLPNKINILGIEYTIVYKESASEVDGQKRTALNGVIDYWERSIRIYDHGNRLDDIWQVLWHEIIHGIMTTLHIDVPENEEERFVDLLATGINDVLLRNDLAEYLKNAKGSRVPVQKGTASVKSRKGQG